MGEAGLFKEDVSWPGSRWRLERRGRRDCIGAAARSYAVTKRSTFSCREISCRVRSLTFQTSLRVLREAGSLPRSARIKWGAGTPDAPLQVPSGTENKLMNAALARVHASSSDAWRSVPACMKRSGAELPLCTWSGCGGRLNGNRFWAIIISDRRHPVRDGPAGKSLLNSMPHASRRRRPDPSDGRDWATWLLKRAPGITPKAPSQRSASAIS